MVSISRKTTDKYPTSENHLRNELKTLQQTATYEQRPQNTNTKAPKRRRLSNSNSNSRCYNIRINMQFCGDTKSVDKNAKNIKKVKIQKYRKWRSLISGFNVVFLIVIVAPFFFNGLLCQGKIFNWILFYMYCVRTLCAKICTHTRSSDLRSELVFLLSIYWYLLVK